MNKHMKVIMLQLVFLVVVGVVLYILYPRTTLDVEGTSINLKSVNANVIVLSENSDFSNPRYLDVQKGEETEIELYPGKYYWKASNNYIEGLKQEFIIDSEVGMKIDTAGGDEEDASLVNIGNVKINVTKGEDGGMIGHIILEPEESQEIANEEGERYTGRQE